MTKEPPCWHVVLLRNQPLPKEAHWKGMWKCALCKQYVYVRPWKGNKK